MRASGPSGELRVGYQRAALLGQWTIALEARLPRAFEFRAVVVSEHAYWRTQQPLDLILTLGNVEWVWRDVQPVREGGAITLTLTARPVVTERVPLSGTKEQRS